ncbi:S8 family serine peptidase [Aminirod propionatiphilus]|uniref:S8 family serine peptidase n=1 Tax=Aminirod propionatiphilus TaxID=3415223 RepID=A0ACD1DU70_9BACT|nr:S8 family serine peptidase [Synergistota bacterium]
MVRAFRFRFRFDRLVIGLFVLLGLSGAAFAGSYLVYPGEGLTTASLSEAAAEGGALEGRVTREMPLSGALVAELSEEEAAGLSPRFSLVPADLPLYPAADPLVDADGHGTAVTGIVVGDRTGVCPYVEVVPVKVADDDGGTSTLWIQDALEHVISLAKGDLKGKKIIVNFSYSTTGNLTAPDSQYATFFANLYKSLASYNIFFVSAAGNSGLNLSAGYYAYPASVSASNEVTASAYRQSGSSVALDKTMNYGYDVVETAAPGTAVVTTNTLGGYTYMDGTSFAAPYVTGIAAYLWANQPGLTPTGVKEALLAMSTGRPAMDVIAGGPLSPELLMDPLPSGATSIPAAYTPHASAWQLDNVAVLRDYPDAFDFSDVVVVVWDTGVAADHPDLTAHLRTALAHDATAASASSSDGGGGGCSLGFAPASLLLVIPALLAAGRR